MSTAFEAFVPQIKIPDEIIVHPEYFLKERPQADLALIHLPERMEFGVSRTR